MLRQFRLLVPIMLFATGSLSAVPLLWTLSGLTFNDGGTASGSFVFDADTSTFSAINIVTTTGSSFAGATYRFRDPGFSTASAPTFVTLGSGDLTGTPLVSFLLTAPLSNAGGTRTIAPGPTEGTCSTSNCTSGAAARSAIAGGSLTSSPAPATVPVGSTGGLALLVILLAVAGWAAIRSSRPTESA